MYVGVTSSVVVEDVDEEEEEEEDLDGFERSGKVSYGLIEYV